MCSFIQHEEHAKLDKLRHTNLIFKHMRKSDEVINTQLREAVLSDRKGKQWNEGRLHK